MKRVNARVLAFSYGGCFLGAGFVSGQELWQFFGSFGVWGYAGLLLAALLFVALGIILIRLIQMTGYDELDRLMVPWEKLSWMRKAIGAIATAFLFGVVIILSAGVGALLHQLFAVPAWIGSAVFAAAVAIIALFGVSGMLNAFSFLTPVLVGATVLFAVGAWCKFDTGHILAITNTNHNPLMPNVVIAALTYVAYNMLGGMSVMVSIGKMVEKKSTTYWGIGFGGLMLAGVAVSVLTSVASLPGAEQAEMPMAAVGSGLSPVLGKCYGVMLLLAMFINALACLVALTVHLGKKAPKLMEKRKLFLIVMAVIMWLGSLFGFGRIISVVFPVFGYLSIVFIICMTVHFFQCKKRKKQEKPEA